MKIIITLTAALLAPLALLAQEKKGPYESDFDLPGSRAEVYKTIGDVKLKIYIYEPKGHKAVGPIGRRSSSFSGAAGRAGHQNNFKSTAATFLEGHGCYGGRLSGGQSAGHEAIPLRS